MGATGQVGHIIAEDLLKRGHTIRAIGRNEKKLRHLLSKGAEIFFYEFDDAEGLKEAFQDCCAVFCMIPPNLKEDQSAYQDRVGEAICEALAKTQVKRVVNLSSLGADHSNGLGPINGLHRQEERLNQLDCIADLIHLRAGYFMENFSSSIPAILYQNEINSPLKADLKIPMVATRDIGWKAADFLERTDPVKKLVFDFAGPQEVSMNEAAQILSIVLDLPQLSYVQISSEEERDKLLKAGVNLKTIDLFLEMYQGFNEGKFKPNQELVDDHCGRTTFDEFAHMFFQHLLYAGRH